MRYIGIDPGLQGGIAVFNENELERLISMPVLKEEDKTGTKLDIHMLNTILFGHCSYGSRILIERQMDKKGNSAKSSKTNLVNYGILLGLIYCFQNFGAANTTFDIVDAKVWQTEMFDVEEIRAPKKDKNGRVRMMRDTKSMSIQTCQKLFPKADLVQGKTKAAKKPKDGLADALLIAAYCKKIHETT